MQPTQYDDINNILELLKKELLNILGDNLFGLYLTGSLTYGDFDRGSSDIDFLAVTNNRLSDDQLQEIKIIHTNIGEQYPEWRKRIEGSYITKEMLLSTTPPPEPRPYVNAGKMWSFVYGKEWILNLHVLYECGIALYGPAPRTIIQPVDITAVRAASKKNLLEEWQPKLEDQAPFETIDYDQNHLQAYAVLTMCRILHRANNEDVASKRAASSWAKKTYGKPWSDLIEKAENWKHGKEMNAQKETLKFIEFTINNI